MKKVRFLLLILLVFHRPSYPVSPYRDSSSIEVAPNKSAYFGIYRKYKNIYKNTIYRELHAGIDLYLNGSPNIYPVNDGRIIDAGLVYINYLF